MAIQYVLNNPVLTLQPGISLGLMGGIAKGCVREVSLAQVSCMLVYVCVAPPTPVGAWSMALGLRRRIECYYTACCRNILPASLADKLQTFFHCMIIMQYADLLLARSAFAGHLISGLCVLKAHTNKGA